jgi:hypothetical protein
VPALQNAGGFRWAGCDGTSPTGAQCILHSFLKLLPLKIFPAFRNVTRIAHGTPYTLHLHSLHLLHLCPLRTSLEPRDSKKFVSWPFTKAFSPIVSKQLSGRLFWKARISSFLLLTHSCSFCGTRDGSQGFQHARQALQQSYIPSPTHSFLSSCLESTGGCTMTSSP